ncbi:unnamed protein product [Hymenolepis diminuta]|uniref:Uncharacterized protein n=1 Tax=Hymenolepis diminuta TaxID=6216 RepID=A0A564Y1Y9_HYMDI|nr:unnamed protein product [Hymenolepis diminuta]
MPTVTLAQTAGNGMRLHTSVRDNVRVTNFTKSMESSTLKVDPTRLVSQLTVPKQPSPSA